MSCSEIVLLDWSAFEQVASYSVPLYVDHGVAMYRGQCEARWPLSSSFQRTCREINAERALKLELDILQVFENRVHLVAEAAELLPEGRYNSLPDRWALMQHYGAPTRLLDWTTSMYVALYFAVSGSFEADGALFSVDSGVVIPTVSGPPAPEHPTDIRMRTDLLLQNLEAEPQVYIWHGARLSRRLAVQQGFFTFSTHVLGDQHALFLAGADTYHHSSGPHDAFTKYVIPAEMKRHFLARLHAMNIGAHTLFPDLAGLGAYVAERAKLGLYPHYIHGNHTTSTARNPK